MTDYAVTIVWDVDPVEYPEGIEEAATAVSDGRLVTTVYVEALSALGALEGAENQLSAFMGGRPPIALAAEPVSTMPHFMLAAYGK
jgi:hypothetical protein